MAIESEKPLFVSNEEGVLCFYGRTGSPKTVSRQTVTRKNLGAPMVLIHKFQFRVGLKFGLIFHAIGYSHANMENAGCFFPC
jgi:hypothetical protein